MFFESHLIFQVLSIRSYKGAFSIKTSNDRFKMLLKVFVVCALVAIAICEDITIDNSIVLPEEKFNNLRAAWER